MGTHTLLSIDTGLPLTSVLQSTVPTLKSAKVLKDISQIKIIPSRQSIKLFHIFASTGHGGTCF